MTHDAQPRPGWIIHDERTVEESRRARFNIASVELPDGTRFEQYVLRMPRASITLALDGQDRVLMLWRHRFIVDRWVWELPGGYVDEHDLDPAATAARELEEETGWRASSVQRLVSFQPMVGTVDSENLVFLARGVEDTGAAPDINESARVAWIPLDDALAYIESGEIVGSASVVGLYAVKLLRERERAQAAAETS